MELFQQILEARDRYIAAQNHLIKLAEEGKSAEGCAYLVVDYQTAATEYRKRVNTLIQFQGELMDQAGKTAEANFQQSRTLMLITGATSP